MISRHAAFALIATLILTASCGVPEQHEPDDIHGRSFFEVVQVQHLNGQWIASGADTQTRLAPEKLAIATSDDGRTWSRHLFDDAPGFFTSAAYGNGRYVAVGGSYEKDGEGVVTVHRAVAVSSDGRDWQMSRAPVQSGGIYTSIVFGDGVFLAATTQEGPGLDHCVIHRSTDGITWEVAAAMEETASYLPSSLYLERFNGPDSYGPTLQWEPASARFLFAGGGAVGHSADGTAWELIIDEAATNATRLQPQKAGVFGSSNYDCCFHEVENGRVDLIVGFEQDAWSFDFTSKRIPDQLAVVNGVTVGRRDHLLDVSSSDWSNWGSWDERDDWPGWVSVHSNLLMTSLAASDSLFVVAGRGIMYSEDGRTWTDATID